MQTISYQSEENIRLDVFLSSKLNESRNQIEQLIKKEYVKVDGQVKTKPGLKLKVGQDIQVDLPTVQKSQSYEVDFDIPVVYEDEYILILNKSSGVVVHGAPSVKEATLVDWLKLKNISLSTISGEERHGIVHRLDKGTSGLIAIAKTNEAHTGLSQQLENKTMGRFYLALIDQPLKEDITIDKAIARSPNNRLKMGIVPSGKNAKTSFIKIALSDNEKYELIGAKLYTGRTHQIRVHLESFNRHILGDHLYGFKGDLNKISRVYLHAYKLYLIHPITNKPMEFTASIPNDMNNFLNDNFNKDGYSEKICSDELISRFDSII